MNDSLIWVDLETTGLVPGNDRILEIAVVLTDGQLNVIDREASVVVAPAMMRGLMSDTVAEMHDKSGLMAELSATPWRPELEARNLDLHFEEFVRQGGAEGSPLAGSSVHFDRSFLKTWMPRLEGVTHYRNFDVSTLKEAARRWYPELPEWEKAGGHRALPDILDSIAEAKYYRARIFA